MAFFSNHKTQHLLCEHQPGKEAFYPRTLSFNLPIQTNSSAPSPPSLNSSCLFSHFFTTPKSISHSDSLPHSKPSPYFHAFFYPSLFVLFSLFSPLPLSSPFLLTCLIFSSRYFSFSLYNVYTVLSLSLYFALLLSLFVTLHCHP